MIFFNHVGRVDTMAIVAMEKWWWQNPASPENVSSLSSPSLPPLQGAGLTCGYSAGEEGCETGFNIPPQQMVKSVHTRAFICPNAPEKYRKTCECVCECVKEPLLNNQRNSHLLAGYSCLSRIMRDTEHLPSNEGSGYRQRDFMTFLIVQWGTPWTDTQL